MSILKCRKKTEHIIQKSIVRWFKKEFPEYIIFSTNNEACYKRKTYFTEAGMLTGVSDLVCILPNKILFIELKTQKTKQSPNQKEFETKLKILNHTYHVIRSLNDFKDLIKNNL